MTEYSDITTATLRRLYSNPVNVVDALESLSNHYSNDDAESNSQCRIEWDRILAVAYEMGVSKDMIAAEVVKRTFSLTAFGRSG